MINFKSINPNESGLKVRTKLNDMLMALISGKDGSNNIWKKITELLEADDDFKYYFNKAYEELKEQVTKGRQYTDASFQDLLVYINGMNGGISGFAQHPSFKPDFPLDKAVTVLATGSGEYTYFLDAEGNPITIEDENVFIIFYKAAGASYWKYKAIPVQVDLDRYFTKEETTNFVEGKYEVLSVRDYEELEEKEEKFYFLIEEE